MNADVNSLWQLVHGRQLGVHFGRPVAPNQFQRSWQIKVSPEISASEARRGLFNGNVSNGVFGETGELPPRELFDFGETEPRRADPTTFIEEVGEEQFTTAAERAFFGRGHGRFLVARKAEVNGND